MAQFIRRAFNACVRNHYDYGFISPNTIIFGTVGCITGEMMAYNNIMDVRYIQKPYTDKILDNGIRCVIPVGLGTTVGAIMGCLVGPFLWPLAGSFIVIPIAGVIVTEIVGR